MLAGRPADLVLAGDEAGGIAEMRREIAGASGTPPGVVALVFAGPGAPDLVTMRAHRLLGEADVVVHDATVSAAVLDLARRDADCVAVDDDGIGPAARPGSGGQAGRAAGEFRRRGSTSDARCRGSDYCRGRAWGGLLRGFAPDPTRGRSSSGHLSRQLGGRRGGPAAQRDRRGGSSRRMPRRAGDRAPRRRSGRPGARRSRPAESARAAESSAASQPRRRRRRPHRAWRAADDADVAGVGPGAAVRATGDPHGHPLLLEAVAPQLGLDRPHDRERERSASDSARPHVGSATQASAVRSIGSNSSRQRHAVLAQNASIARGPRADIGQQDFCSGVITGDDANRCTISRSAVRIRSVRYRRRGRTRPARRATNSPSPCSCQPSRSGTSRCGNGGGGSSLAP